MVQHSISELLQEAAQKCLDRGLVQAAKWAAEQLIGSNQPPKNIQPANHHTPRYLLALTYFQSHEYDRAANTLQSLTDSKSIFLRLYSKFLAGERRMEENSTDIIGPLEGSKAENLELDEIYSELVSILQNDHDPFLIYLYGVICIRKKLLDKAMEVLIQSVNAYPYNWSAWTELLTIVKNQDTLEKILPKLPMNNFMTNFFLAQIHLDLQTTASDSGMKILTELLETFPESCYLKSRVAMAHYDTKEFEEAESIFDSLINEHPHMLDCMDYYSNVLYVMEKKGKLSYLAHKAVLVDKYRPETCCIIGNYHSLKGQHELAASYFQRALKLNRSYSQAWTLLGHELLELKNTPAAIEAYRKATDSNDRDYRAWYGLGQTYEVLRMPYYSLFYYQKSVALRPYDPRMWTALGGIYDALEQTTDAIKCYKRAFAQDNDIQTGFKLARAYVSLEDIEMGVKCHRICYNESKAMGFVCLYHIWNFGLLTGWVHRQVLNLRNHYYRDNKDYREAAKYVNDIVHTEEGKALRRELTSTNLFG